MRLRKRLGVRFDLTRNRASQPNKRLAADGAIACFLKKSYFFRLNADRAAQLKRGIRWSNTG